MSPDERQAWEDDERVPSDFTGVHPVKLAPDAPQGTAAGEQNPMQGEESSVSATSKEPQRLDRERVARWQRVIENTKSWWPHRIAEQVMAVADAEQAALVRERDEARAEVERLQWERGDWQAMARIEVHDRLGQLRLERDEARAEVKRLRRRIDDGLAILNPLTEAVESECEPDGGLCHEHDMYDGRCALVTDLERAAAALASVPAPTDEAGVERPSPSCHDQRCAGMPACLSCVATDEAGA